MPYIVLKLSSLIFCGVAFVLVFGSAVGFFDQGSTNQALFVLLAASIGCQAYLPANGELKIRNA